MGCLLKNIFFLLITICLAVSFQGCSSEENTAVAGSNSNHFEADIQENLRVDANVEIPNGVVVPVIYEVKLAAPGEEGIETFLTEMGDTILNRNVSDLDDSQQIFAQTAKGTFVLNRTFSQKYQGCSFYYDTEMDSAYKSSYVLNYYG